MQRSHFIQSYKSLTENMKEAGIWDGRGMPDSYALQSINMSTTQFSNLADQYEQYKSFAPLKQKCDNNGTIIVHPNDHHMIF